VAWLSCLSESEGNLIFFKVREFLWCSRIFCFLLRRLTAICISDMKNIKKEELTSPGGRVMNRGDGQASLTEVEKSGPGVESPPIRLEVSSEKDVLPDVSQILPSDTDLEQDIEDAWASDRGGLPIGWLYLFAFLILGLAGWGAYRIFQPHTSNQVTLLEQRRVLEEKNAGESEEIKSSLDGLEDCVRGYYKFEGTSKMLNFVRHPDRVAPMIKDYYARYDVGKFKFQKFEHLRAVSIEGKAFVYATVVVIPEGTRSLLIEQVEADRYRVDWESSVMYQPMAWGSYVLKKPLKSMDMHVQVKVDDFYAHRFKDEKLYQCYQLTALGSDEYLFGYVERGSAVADQIQAALETATKKAKGSHIDIKDDPLQFELEANDDYKKLEKVFPKINMIMGLRFLREDNSKRGVKIEALLSESLIYVHSQKAR